jgi:hypothetical protein
MRKVRSQPLGATRFRAVQVLDDLKIYEAEIKAHRQEARLLEAERLNRLQEAEAAARLLAKRREEERLSRSREAEAAARILAERISHQQRSERAAIERMDSKQLKAWLWERRVATWLREEGIGEG